MRQLVQTLAYKCEGPKANFVYIDHTFYDSINVKLVELFEILTPVSTAVGGQCLVLL